MNKISVQTAAIIDVFGIDEGFRMIHEAGFDGVDFNAIDMALPGSKIARGELDSIYDKSDEETNKSYHELENETSAHTSEEATDDQLVLVSSDKQNNTPDSTQAPAEVSSAKRKRPRPTRRI